MSRKHTGIFKAGLSFLHGTGAGRLMAPLTRGMGAILTLHHVRPDPAQAFEPNRILKITPDFLDRVILQVKASGFDIVSIDEAVERIRQGDEQRPFVSFTFDDGYRDNRDFALPVFRKHGVPLCVYVATEFADGRGDLWWLALEAALRRIGRVHVVMEGCRREFEIATVAQKYDAFHEIYWWVRGLPEAEGRLQVSQICEQAGYDPSGLCRELVMDWDELREFAADPLVTIGAHTKGHWAVGKLSHERALEEVQASVLRIEDELRAPCRHFSFPYGCEKSAGSREFEMVRELGLASAVTTRKDVIRAGSTDLQWSLPRLSLNGDYQETRYVDVLLSGVPFLLWNAAERLRSFARPAARAHQA